MLGGIRCENHSKSIYQTSRKSMILHLMVFCLNWRFFAFVSCTNRAMSLHKAKVMDLSSTARQ